MTGNSKKHIVASMSVLDRSVKFACGRGVIHIRQNLDGVRPGVFFGKSLAPCRRCLNAQVRSVPSPMPAGPQPPMSPQEPVLAAGGAA